MIPQHKDEMHWETAPAWATHIVGWHGEPQTCYWAEECEGRFFSEKERESRFASFGLIDEDDEDDTFGWVIVSTRPNTG